MQGAARPAVVSAERAALHAFADPVDRTMDEADAIKRD
jgi:hypothetical protein